MGILCLAVQILKSSSNMVQSYRHAQSSIASHLLPSPRKLAGRVQVEAALPAQTAEDSWVPLHHLLLMVVAFVWGFGLGPGGLQLSGPRLAAQLCHS